MLFEPEEKKKKKRGKQVEERDNEEKDRKKRKRRKRKGETRGGIPGNKCGINHIEIIEECVYVGKITKASTGLHQNWMANSEPPKGAIFS